MNKSENQSRRKFLSLGVLSGVALIAQQVQAEPLKPTNEKEEMMQLLTPDGKLVEVKKTLIQKTTSGRKASNQEILTWTQSVKTKS